MVNGITQLNLKMSRLFLLKPLVPHFLDNDMSLYPNDSLLFSQKFQLQFLDLNLIYNSTHPLVFYFYLPLSVLSLLYFAIPPMSYLTRSNLNISGFLLFLFSLFVFLLYPKGIILNKHNIDNQEVTYHFNFTFNGNEYIISLALSVLAFFYCFV